MKDTTLEGRAKTKNGVARLAFSVLCILLEVVFIVALFTRLNRYAEALNLLTRVLGLIVILNMYASPVTSTIKMPWILLDPRISDHGTWTVSAGWSEWRYGKDAKALSEN